MTKMIKYVKMFYLETSKNQQIVVINNHTIHGTDVADSNLYMFRQTMAFSRELLSGTPFMMTINKMT